MHKVALLKLERKHSQSLKKPMSQVHAGHYCISSLLLPFKSPSLSPMQKMSGWYMVGDMCPAASAIDREIYALLHKESVELRRKTKLTMLERTLLSMLD